MLADVAAAASVAATPVAAAPVAATAPGSTSAINVCKHLWPLLTPSYNTAEACLPATVRDNLGSPSLGTSFTLASTLDSTVSTPSLGFSPADTPLFGVSSPGLMPETLSSECHLLFTFSQDLITHDQKGFLKSRLMVVHKEFPTVPLIYYGGVHARYPHGLYLAQVPTGPLGASQAKRLSEVNALVFTDGQSFLACPHDLIIHSHKSAAYQGSEEDKQKVRDDFKAAHVGIQNFVQHSDDHSIPVLRAELIPIKDVREHLQTLAPASQAPSPAQAPASKRQRTASQPANRRTARAAAPGPAAAPAPAAAPGKRSRSGGAAPAAGPAPAPAAAAACAAAAGPAADAAPAAAPGKRLASILTDMQGGTTERRRELLQETSRYLRDVKDKVIAEMGRLQNFSSSRALPAFARRVITQAESVITACDPIYQAALAAHNSKSVHPGAKPRTAAVNALNKFDCAWRVRFHELGGRPPPPALIPRKTGETIFSLDVDGEGKQLIRYAVPTTAAPAPTAAAPTAAAPTAAAPTSAAPTADAPTSAAAAAAAAAADAAASATTAACAQATPVAMAAAAAASAAAIGAGASSGPAQPQQPQLPHSQLQQPNPGATMASVDAELIRNADPQVVALLIQSQQVAMQSQTATIQSQQVAMQQSHQTSQFVMRTASAQQQLLMYAVGGAAGTGGNLPFLSRMPGLRLGAPLGGSPLPNHTPLLTAVTPVSQPLQMSQQQQQQWPQLHSSPAQPQQWQGLAPGLPHQQVPPPQPPPQLPPQLPPQPLPPPPQPLPPPSLQPQQMRLSPMPPPQQQLPPPQHVQQQQMQPQLVQQQSLPSLMPSLEQVPLNEIESLLSRATSPTGMELTDSFFNWGAPFGSSFGGGGPGSML